MSGAERPRFQTSAHRTFHGTEPQKLYCPGQDPSDAASDPIAVMNLPRVYDCPAGSILLDGVDIREFSLSSLYRRLGIVSQDVWILNRSLRENLVFGLDDPPSDEELLQLLADLQLHGLLEASDRPLDLELGDRGIMLSGGQRQRVALARVLLRHPEILFIAHRLSTLRGADRIVVLEGGRVVEQGTWDELLASDGAFAQLHRTQFSTEGT